MTILITSLAEIRSFNPCPDGWKDILSAHPHKTEKDRNKQFSLINCVESNSISDVCWLLGKRKVEISICTQFANACAESVKHLNNKYSKSAAASASYTASYTAAYASAASASGAAADTAYASAADAAAAAASDAAYAVAAASDYAADPAYIDVIYTDVTYVTYVIYKQQRTKNKQFLIDAIKAYESNN